MLWKVNGTATSTCNLLSPPSPCDVVCGVVLCVGVRVVCVVWSVVWCWWSWCVFGVCVCCVTRRALAWILPNSSLRIGRTRHGPDSFNHSLYLMRPVQLQLQ